MGYFQLDRMISWECHPKIVIRENPGQLVEAIIDLLEERLLQRLSQPKSKPLGLATGRTMEPVYRALVSRLYAWPPKDLEQLLRSWQSFNLDEYVGLAERDSRSFKSYMFRHLGRPLEMGFEQIRLPNGHSDEVHKEARSYAKQLQAYGGIGIQLIGLGNNGHIGFNEPPCSSTAACRVVNLSRSTREQNAFSFNNDLKEVPYQAITLGLTEILAADEIHMIVTGDSKAEILDALLQTSCSNLLPASWLALHKNVCLWVDYAALSKTLKSNSFLNDSIT